MTIFSKIDGFLKTIVFNNNNIKNNHKSFSKSSKPLSGLFLKNDCFFSENEKIIFENDWKTKKNDYVNLAPPRYNVYEQDGECSIFTLKEKPIIDDVYPFIKFQTKQTQTKHTSTTL